LAFLSSNATRRDAFAQSPSDRTEKATLTRTEAQHRKVVMVLVRRVQMGALQKYEGDLIPHHTVMGRGCFHPRR
jgi:hypothetical protein